GDARALQDHAHEDEERNRDQHFVGHRAEVAVGERSEVGRIEDAEIHAYRAEAERDTGQRKRDREPEHEEADDAKEHQAGEKLADKYRIHLAITPDAPGSGIR